MAIVRTQKTGNPFVQIDKYSLMDSEITWKAKGILAHLLSRPNHWQVYLSELEKNAADGKDSLRSGIKELEDKGYIQRKRVRDQGKFKGWEYVVYERPLTERGITEVGKYDIGKTEVGESENGKADTSNNDLSNNDLSNNDLSNNDLIPYVEIVEYLNYAANKNYRHTTRKTRSLIKARFNEGFTLDDFKKVIDIKVSEWGRNPKMKKYLRPETLFGTKFESYLNQEGGEQPKDEYDDLF